MRRLRFILLTLLATLVAAPSVCAQERKDTVRYRRGDKIHRVSGRVLRDTWQSVDVDTDEDGEVDQRIPGAQVRQVTYGKLPMYILNANLQKSRNPKKFVEVLTEKQSIYDDATTPKGVLQYAYYDVALACARLARAGEPGMLAKTEQAFGKLFTDIPDTRHIVNARLELGKLCLELGESEKAVRQFKTLAEGNYGPKVVLLSKLMAARVDLSLKRYADALATLRTIRATGALAEEVELLHCRALVGQKKLDEARTRTVKVLSNTESRKVLGMAYCVLGDYFAARGRHETALTAYLKVLLMYGDDTDTADRSRALKEAKSMLARLWRAAEAKDLETRIGR